MTTKLISNEKISSMQIPLVLAVIAIFFWNSPLLLPAKLLTVFFHELSHGLAAILTGGQIESIEININQGGVCHFRGGWFFLTASAGYLGSLLWGAGILLVSLKKGISRGLTKTIGIIILTVSLLWIRDWQTLAISLSTGAALIYVSSKLREEYCDIFIKFISLISCFYVVFDIKNDLIDRSVTASDAYILSERLFPSFMVGAGSYIIGILWLAIAVFVIWKVFSYVLNSK